jgi:cytochrome P450
MVRAIRRIRHDPVAFLQSVRDEHGGVAQFPIPSPATYLVSDPEVVRRVLVTNAGAYGKRTLQYSTLALVTGDGLLAADTETWRPHRRILAPAFHHSAVAPVAEHVAHAVERVDRTWSARCKSSATGTAVVDVGAAMDHLALEVVGRKLFGADLTGQAAQLTRATLRGMDEVVARARNPLAPPTWWPTPGNRRLRRSVARLDAAAAAILAARRTDPAAGACGGPDLLDVLLASPELGARAVRDEIATFIVAGHETVAVALTWAWYLLAGDRAAAERLRAEADAVLPDRDAVLTAAHAAGLPYARAVVEETLRLYPSAWLITRRARADDVLAGISVPEGALLIISPWLLHRDPGQWDAPDTFCPERFGPERDRPRLAYLPFGAGPRLCIGRDMALLESVLTLAALARRFELSAVDRQPVRAVPGVTVRPAGGLRLRARRRR